MTAAIPDDLASDIIYAVSGCCCDDCLKDATGIIAAALQDERNRATEAYAFVDWVETWVSNPVGAYSVHALDGLFGMARDRIASIRDKPPTGE